MRYLVIIFLMLVTVPVLACDSYDNCMWFCGEDGTYLRGYNNNKLDKNKYQLSEANCIKAIAYKLDEISDSLNRQIPPINWMTNIKKEGE